MLEFLACIVFSMTLFILVIIAAELLGIDFPADQPWWLVFGCIAVIGVILGIAVGIWEAIGFPRKLRRWEKELAKRETKSNRLRTERQPHQQVSARMLTSGFSARTLTVPMDLEKALAEAIAFQCALEDFRDSLPRWLRRSARLEKLVEAADAEVVKACENLEYAEKFEEFSRSDVLPPWLATKRYEQEVLEPLRRSINKPPTGPYHLQLPLF